jgi:hypothetical protein
MKTCKQRVLLVHVVGTVPLNFYGGMARMTTRIANAAPRKIFCSIEFIHFRVL